MTVDHGLRVVVVLGLAAACGGSSSGAGGSEDSSSSTGDPTMPTSSASDDPTSGGDPTTGDMLDSSDSGDMPTATTDTPDPPLPCPEDFSCKADEDGDGKPIECDNAPWVANADQGDMDYDSIGDVVDMCPTVQQIEEGGDSDKDGVGTRCDTCPKPASFYDVAMLDERYAVRSTPAQHDADRDGVGDACDNCPTIPNCLDYGDGPGLVPHAPGDPLDPEDPGCQQDADLDGIGDACEGMTSFADTDDFDGDGIANGVDLCPRLQLAEGSNHPDPDGDGFGTECDVCPFVADPSQLDSDGDFVGDACEEHSGCVERPRARPLAFYDVAVGGYCCTTFYQGQALSDPDGNPLSADDLPADTPGLIALPPGCDAALAEAGVSAATRLAPADVGGLDALWDYVCLLPSWDQDLDGIPDECDLCSFAFDPNNTPYTDANGMLWPNDGAYCNGDYSCENE